MNAATAKKKLFLLRFLFCLCAVLMLISIASTISHVVLKANTYSKLTNLSAATQADQQAEAYIAALQLSPDKPDAYLKLLEVYAQDGIFQKRESEEFLSIYNAYHHKLSQNSEGYAQLQKQAGFLYINGYEESATTSIRMAMPFLGEALDRLSPEDPDYQTVGCYYRIGSYYADYIWSATTVREISPEIMDALLTDIEQTLTQLCQQDNIASIYDQLGFSVAVCNLLYDQRDVLAATVPKEKVSTILYSIYDAMPEKQSLQKARTIQLWETLDNNRSIYFDMINRAYARKGGT